MRISKYAEFAGMAAVATLAATVFVGCKTAEPAAEPEPAPPGASQTEAARTAPAAPVRVEVTNHGFQPNRVNLKGGRQVVFRRTSESTCATAVVFPDLGIEKQLPLNADVVVDLPASASGEVGFQCGMGMYKSKVVVQ